MSRITFKTLLRDCAHRRGLNPDGLSETDRNAIASFAGDRLQQAWEWGAWPGWSFVDRVTPVPTWSGSVAYASGVTVWDHLTSAFYLSVQATPAGTAPTDTAYWTPTAPAATGDYAMVFGVYLQDPREWRRSMRLADFTTGPQGIILPCGRTSGAVWVHYRISPPKLTATPWAVGTAYGGGDVVWDDVLTGDCYLALTASTGVSPSTDTTKWRAQRIPDILADMLKTGVAADFLRAGGQYDQAGAQDAKAEQALIRAYDKAMRQTQALGVTGR